MLLETLLAFVRRDAAPPGMSGTVCIGVSFADRPPAWLRVRLGAKAEAELVEQHDPSATAALVLGEREAESLVRGAPLPSGAPFVRVFGDEGLLQRFLERYLSRRDVIRTRGGL